MRKLKTLGAALIVALVLVTCADYVSFAATGSSLILGHGNSANKITGLSRTTSGPALNLHTSTTSSAPFSTNATGKVANLNADRLDGLNSTAMVNKTYVFEKAISESSVSQISVNLPTMPAGDYMITLDAWFYAPSTGDVFCGISEPTSGRWLETWMPARAAGFYTPHITGLMSLPGADALNLVCTGDSGSWSTFSGEPLQVTMTPVAAAVSGTFAARTRTPTSPAVR